MRPRWMSEGLILERLLHPNLCLLFTVSEKRPGTRPVNSVILSHLLGLHYNSPDSRGDCTFIIVFRVLRKT